MAVDRVIAVVLYIKYGSLRFVYLIWMKLFSYDILLQKLRLKKKNHWFILGILNTSKNSEKVYINNQL